MRTRTWNVKLMATDEQPETTVEGLSEVETKKILRELMYGSGLRDHEILRAGARSLATDRHEGPLAA